MRFKIIMVLSTCAVFGTVLVWRARHAPPSGAIATSATAIGGDGSEEDIHALETQLDALRGEMGDLRRAQRARGAASGAASAPPPPPPPEPGEPSKLSDSERRKEAEEHHFKIVTALDARVQRDAKDPKWTADMRAALAAAVSGAPGSVVGAVDCHTNMCRMEVSHEDRQALERFTNEQARTLHYDMQILVSPNGGGFDSEVFVAQAGQSLPKLNRELAANQ